MNKNILIVEDSEAIGKMLGRLFAHRGDTATVCDCVSEVEPIIRDRARLCGFDCVILDMMLPDGDGVDLFLKIARSGCPTRVVIYSSCVEMENFRELKHLGVFAVIAKPSRFDDLYLALFPEDAIE